MMENTRQYRMLCQLYDDRSDDPAYNASEWKYEPPWRRDDTKELTWSWSEWRLWAQYGNEVLNQMEVFLKDEADTSEYYDLYHDNDWICIK